MASLKMRYGGNIVNIQEGFNYNSSYGTVKLNVKVNSTSTLKLGLTTNTNAQEYCKLKIKVGNQVAYIGRVSNTSYISGNAVDYNGSTTVSRSQYISSDILLIYGRSTSNYPIRTSSEQTATGFTTQSYTNNPGSGNGTSAADPHYNQTIQNLTGSTVTTRVESASIVTSQKTSWTWYNWQRTTTVSHYTYGDATNVKITRNFSFKHSRSVEHSYYTGNGAISAGESSTGNAVTKGEATKSWKTSFKWTSRVEGDYVTQNSVSGTTKNGTRGTSTASYWQTQTRRYSQTTSVKNMTSTTSNYVTRVDSGWYSHGASTTYYSYSTRWSYWWTSCSKYTNTTYCTSVTHSTTSVSETMHNMNL